MFKQSIVIICLLASTLHAGPEVPQRPGSSLRVDSPEFVPIGYNSGTSSVAQSPVPQNFRGITPPPGLWRPTSPVAGELTWLRRELDDAHLFWVVGGEFGLKCFDNLGKRWVNTGDKEGLRTLLWKMANTVCQMRNNALVVRNGVGAHSFLSKVLFNTLEILRKYGLHGASTG